MASSASDLFCEVGSPGTATTLSSPGYTSGVSTSITVGSTTNWPTATGIIFAIDEVTLNATTGKYERTAGTYNEFEGTVASATSITNVDYVGGDAERTYPAGALTRVYIPLGAEWGNRLAQGLRAEHSQLDGTHTDITPDSITVAGNIDVNDASTAIRDTSDNELVKFAKTASAVNEVTVTNNSTGNPPIISATGGDANIPIRIAGKGTGAVQLYVNGVDQLGAWQSWTPTWTNLTVGNGTEVAKYIQIGKTVHFRIELTLGSTTSIAGSVQFSLPVNVASTMNVGPEPTFGFLSMIDAGTQKYPGFIDYAAPSTNRGRLFVVATGGTYGTFAGLSSTVPFTWATGDSMALYGTYEAA